MYYVYLLRCADGSLYCGITNDIEKRVNEHNSAGGRGAKYLRAKKPVILIYTEKHKDRSSALIREHAIKKMSKAEKEALVLEKSMVEI